MHGREHAMCTCSVCMQSLRTEPAADKVWGPGDGRHRLLQECCQLQDLVPRAGP